MALFQVYVRAKHSLSSESPLWSNSISAASIEEAYRIGKAQFETEWPDLAHEQVSIEATSAYVEK
ncbi:hypothetical protein LG198_11975 [Methylobacillus arboreus]|uniref:hypothetical protein n=1 Tax=Methylobacillus arboreus TaxID=755170 RepID=UPI001E2AE386|nr:hypothetical protein [Methylobacillus arboreus]MCB5191446.1 hypothetical protein [Methylobacillus arboreus]